MPGVSIIRPLKGLDANLFENIESSFKQDYPKFEVLLAVAKENDQAVPVVKELLEKYPQVDATLIIGRLPFVVFVLLSLYQTISGEEVVGVNPKVNNLMRSFQAAKYDILWVIDSNIQLAHGALARAVDVLDPPESSFVPDKPGKRRVALVHHVPLAFTTENLLGARVEEAFLNTNHAKMYIAINALALDSCVVGKSNLYRKSDINRLTATLKPPSKTPVFPPSEVYGLAAFGRFLAEDNTIGAALWHELDVRHGISCDVALNAIGDMNLSGYIWRRIRWIRVRKHMVLVATLLEPFTESVLSGLLSAWAIHSLLMIPFWTFIPIHFSLWLMVDVDILSTLAGEPLPRSRLWTFFRAWVYRELLAFPIFLYAVFGNEVEWRGQKYRITSRGEAMKVV